MLKSQNSDSLLMQSLSEADMLVQSEMEKLNEALSVQRKKHNLYTRLFDLTTFDEKSPFGSFVLDIHTSTSALCLYQEHGGLIVTSHVDGSILLSHMTETVQVE